MIKYKLWADVRTRFLLIKKPVPVEHASFKCESTLPILFLGNSRTHKLQAMLLLSTFVSRFSLPSPLKNYASFTLFSNSPSSRGSICWNSSGFVYFLLFIAMLLRPYWLLIFDKANFIQFIFSMFGLN